jgi:hypothetical protein
VETGSSPEGQILQAQPGPPGRPRALAGMSAREPADSGIEQVAWRRDAYSNGCDEVNQGHILFLMSSRFLNRQIYQLKCYSYDSAKRLY